MLNAQKIEEIIHNLGTGELRLYFKKSLDYEFLIGDIDTGSIIEDEDSIMAYATEESKKVPFVISNEGLFFVYLSDPNLIKITDKTGTLILWERGPVDPIDPKYDSTQYTPEEIRQKQEEIWEQQKSDYLNNKDK
jgi:hypothetical protein